MAKRKPRKRDYVPPVNEIVNKKERVTPRQRQRQSPRGGARDASGRRVPDPPSWIRVFKRLPVYFIALVALQYFVPSASAKGLSDSERLQFALLQGAFFTVAFTPMIYYFERIMYNRYMKRMGLADDGRAAKQQRATEVIEGSVVDDEEQ